MGVPDRVDQLAVSLERKFIQFRRVPSLAEAVAHVAGLVQPGEDVLASGPAWLAAPPHGCTVPWTYLPDVPPPATRARLARIRVGVSGAFALVASTGTVVLAEQGGLVRALSSLAEVHVVIAGAQRVVPDLESAMAALREAYAGTVPRYVSLITGPSRSGDIEFKVVRGLHGPREVHVILLDREPGLESEGRLQIGRGEAGERTAPLTQGAPAEPRAG